LGDGLRLFGGPLTEERWDLKNVVAYKNGFVELSYSAPQCVRGQKRRGEFPPGLKAGHIFTLYGTIKVKAVP
jgi:hypothetical protein